VKPHAHLLLGLVLALATPAGAETALVLGLAGEPSPAPSPPALVAGTTVSLRLLLPADHSAAESTARLLQAAGPLAAPLPAEVRLAADPDDPRLTLAVFEAPPVQRVTTVLLEIARLEPLSLQVYPAAPRADLPSLAEALHRSGIRLQVSGRSSTLRAQLRAEKLDFDDLGPAAPERLESGALLIADLEPAAWQALREGVAEAPRGSRLLAFVPDPDLLPGIYPAAGLSGDTATCAKITLPVLERLPSDPRARETLHHLLLLAFLR
jgi:hypothetical protein